MTFASLRRLRALPPFVLADTRTGAATREGTRGEAATEISLLLAGDIRTHTPHAVHLSSHPTAVERVCKFLGATSRAPKMAEFETLDLLDELLQRIQLELEPFLK